MAEILVLSNDPPCLHPPPAPGFTDEGLFSVQFPAQKNWHSDQSYRRPPPDASLLLAIKIPPDNQGQTLYADCFLAYRTLNSNLRKRIEKTQCFSCPGLDRSVPPCGGIW
ncbi:MAG: taurine dioxygenase, partial [Gammaproteobacteria bacterium]